MHFAGVLANGGISWLDNGVIFRKSNDVVVWTYATEYTSGTIDFRYGTYIDLTSGIGTEYILSNPVSDQYVITLKYAQPSRSTECGTLIGSFRLVDSSTYPDSIRDVSRLRLDTKNK